MKSKLFILIFIISSFRIFASKIANTTNVNSGVGLDRPVMYKNGVYIKL